MNLDYLMKANWIAHLKTKVILVFLVFLCSCHHTTEDLEPKISYCVQDKYLKGLPSPFAPLSEEEKNTDWGKEYTIGTAFAKQLDLYQAITSFKRADILLPPGERKMEAQYEILLCYYLGKKYDELIYTYENSCLRGVTQEFPAFHDLLVLLYDSYLQLGEDTKAEAFLGYIKQIYPKTGDTLTTSTTLIQACPGYEEYLPSYSAHKKSVGLAKGLNALLPGSGYLYLGQKQSALTAFLLNGSFIAAAYHFFHHGDTAAGIIVTSFEAGWYFGGIHGASLEAKFYNERLYECEATPMMNQKGLFPVFTLKYAF